jgi:hypothetical protein
MVGSHLCSNELPSISFTVKCFYPLQTYLSYKEDLKPIKIYLKICLKKQYELLFFCLQNMISRFTKQEKRLVYFYQNPKYRISCESA